MPREKDYWFPPKRYGWGWGFPVRWQGWVVLFLYLGLISLSIARIPPSRNMALFLAVIMSLTAVLITICWATGAPPRWRWGKDKPARATDSIDPAAGPPR